MLQFEELCDNQRNSSTRILEVLGQSKSDTKRIKRNNVVQK